MLKTPVKTALLASLMIAASGANEPAPTYYQANWESLRNYEVPEWYYDAKFGIWPIWGIYSVPEFRGDHAAEWYPKWMYLKKDPSGKPFNTYDQQGAAIAQHHRDTYGDPSAFGYHDFIPMFKAEKWDPDEWAQFGVDCGARFFTVLAEFCDNFAMYDSSYTRWNAFEMGPKRDITGELATAVRAKDMKFGISCHLSYAENFYKRYYENGFSEGNEHLADFYTEKLDDRFRQNWWNRVTELVNKYNPDLYYFDWCWNSAFWDNDRPEFCAYYYNQAIRNGTGTLGQPNVVLNYKSEAIGKGCAVLDLERGTMSSAQDFIWQTDTSVSDYSWGYSKTDQYKTGTDLVTLLTDIVSKNGILLLAFGPKADGTIPEEYKTPMLELGAWLEKNGEAIYATRPWQVAAEGPTSAGNHHHSQTYTAKDIRYTRSKDGSKLYAVAFGLPHGELTLLSTRVDGGAAKGKVTLLANGTDIPFTVNAKKQIVLDGSGLTAENAGCEHAFAFRIEGMKVTGAPLTATELSEAYLDDVKDYAPYPGTFTSDYPYLSGAKSAYEIAHNGVKRDTNYFGKTPILIGGQPYERGLMACPAGSQGRGIFIVGLTDLPKAKGFTAEVGIEDSVDDLGSSAFIVEACVKGTWKQLFKSRVLTGKDDPVNVEVELPKDAEYLRLITTDGGDGGSADHAVWANAMFTE